MYVLDVTMSLYLYVFTIFHIKGFIFLIVATIHDTVIFELVFPVPFYAF